MSCCFRCSAITSEERIIKNNALRKVSTYTYIVNVTRCHDWMQCATCQSVFTVSEILADQPMNIDMNCQRSVLIMCITSHINYVITQVW